MQVQRPRSRQIFWAGTPMMTTSRSHPAACHMMLLDSSTRLTRMASPAPCPPSTSRLLQAALRAHPGRRLLGTPHDLQGLQTQAGQALN